MRLAKAAEVGRILEVSKQLRASVLDLSGNVERAAQARDAARQSDASKPRAELVENTKREGLAALKTLQTERRKSLDQAKDVGRDKDRGLELTRTGSSKGPRSPGDGHGR